MNLQNYQELTVIFMGRCHCKLFSKTQLFSLSQLLKDKLQTNYYKYPLKSNEDKPIYKIDASFYSDFKKPKLVKINEKSMLGLIDQQKINKGYLFVFIQKINQKGQSESDTYKFPLKFNKPTFIYDIWQVQHEVIYISLCKQEKYENYIWQYKLGKYRKTLFSISENHQLQILGQFRTLETSQKNLPIYYVDMFQQKILAIQTFEKNQSYRQYIYPLYNCEMQYLYIDQRVHYNINQQEFIRKIKWEKFSYKMLLTFLVNSLCGSFDQDLIDMAVHLILNQQNNQ